MSKISFSEYLKGEWCSGFC